MHRSSQKTPISFVVGSLLQVVFLSFSSLCGGGHQRISFGKWNCFYLFPLRSSPRLCLSFSATVDRVEASDIGAVHLPSHRHFVRKLLATTRTKREDVVGRGCFGREGRRRGASRSREEREEWAVGRRREGGGSKKSTLTLLFLLNWPPLGGQYCYENTPRPTVSQSSYSGLYSRA